jgi:hypothetical protein
MSSIDQNMFTEEFLSIDPALVGRAIVAVRPEKAVTHAIQTR